MAMNATALSFALPRNPLTKITGKPNFAAAAELHKELFKNATPVRSAQGRQCGHLGMAMPAAQHNAMPGAQPWVDPPSPGTLQLPAGAAQHQMATLADTRNCSAKEQNMWVELSSKLKQQILDAVDETHTDELSNRLAGRAAVSAGGPGSCSTTW
jgi:hypothetical protein